MVPFDPSIGEFRIHYAGFFDPGFGYGAQGEIPGTKAVLEVRAHEIPILLEHGQLVGKLIYHQMAQLPDKVYGRSIGSSYQQQGLALSKQFIPLQSREQEPVSGHAPVLSPQMGIAATLLAVVPPRRIRACGFVALDMLGNLDDALRRRDRTLPTVRLEVAIHKLRF